MRVKFTLLLCTASLISLVGCGQPPSSTASSQAKSSPVAAAPAASSAQGSYSQLLDVVAKTDTAVQAKDFTKAQQEFGQFEGVWSQVEDGIKQKSPASYDAIEQDMDKVSAALKSSQPDPASTALSGMKGHIQSIPQ